MSKRTALLALGLAALACSLPGQAPLESPAPGAEVPVVGVTVTPAPFAPTGQAPAPAEEAPPPVAPVRAFYESACDGGHSAAWCVLEDGTTTQVTRPVENPEFWDYAPATNRVLYGSHFPDRGAGPGSSAVSDLWTVDLTTGQAQPIVQEDLVTWARWAPNGQDFAYIFATETTYELRWHAASGEDKLLATDVPLMFEVSPSGDEVAFVRREGYDLDAPASLHVVSVASGQTRKLTDVDLSGGGSIYDQPFWSPDGRTILMQVTPPTNWGLLRAAADGSSNVILSVDAAVSATQEGFDNLPGIVLWHPDGQRFLGTVQTGIMTPDFTTWVLMYEMDPALERVVGVQVVAQDAELIDWDRPGQSVWVRPLTAESSGTPVTVPLP